MRGTLHRGGSRGSAILRAVVAPLTLAVFCDYATTRIGRKGLRGNRLRVRMGLAILACMRAEEIYLHAHRQPFRPIRVYLSDGSVHEVHHPEMMMISRRQVTIGVPSDNERIPETMLDYVYIDTVHITRIEPFDAEPHRAAEERAS